MRPLSAGSRAPSAILAGAQRRRLMRTSTRNEDVKTVLIMFQVGLKTNNLLCVILSKDWCLGCPHPKLCERLNLGVMD